MSQLLVCGYCRSELIKQEKRLIGDQYEGIVRFKCADCGYHMTFDQAKVRMDGDRYVFV